MKAFVHVVAALASCCVLLTGFATPPCRAQVDPGARALIVAVESRMAGPGEIGSGILFAQQNRFLYIATANHVVRRGARDAEDVKVRFSFWPDEMLPARLLDRYDSDLDLAVLRVDLRDLPIELSELEVLDWQRLADAEELEPGSGLYPLGSPSGQGWYAPHQPVPFRKLVSGEIEFDYDCSKGYSGGGLFNERWGLVGMLVTSSSEVCRAVQVHLIYERLQRDWGFRIDLEPMGPPEFDQRVVEDAQAPEEDSSITVAVVDFDNRSGYSLRDVGPLAHEVLKTFLVGLPNVRVVTRDRLQSLQSERELQRQARDERRVRTTRTQTEVTEDTTVEGDPIDAGTQESFDQQTTQTVTETEEVERLLQGPDSRQRRQAYRASRTLGADYLLTGSVLRYDHQRRALDRYKLVNDTFRMSVSLQMLDLATGQLRFSKTFDTEARENYSRGSAPERPPSKEYELLSDLMEQAGDELRNALYAKQRRPDDDQQVLVEFHSRPSGAQVFLDGVLVGSTPISLMVDEGIQVVTCKRRGYGDWESDVMLREGQKVFCEMGR